MSAIFYDERITPNPLNGTRIERGNQLVAILDQLPKADPFFCKLEAENGYELLFGIGQDYGCLQYSRSDGDPPYLVAVTTDESDDGDGVEFRLGNEPTPVSKHRCLPFTTAREIASYFVETGERSPNVPWEEA